MTCTLRYVDGPAQSGKTFLCVAAVAHAQSLGHPTLWLSSTVDHARVVQRVYRIPGHVRPWSARATGQPFSVIVVDTWPEIWTPDEIEELRCHNERRAMGPSVLLVTRLTP